MIVIVCGVSGSGKTTIGERLAQALQVAFYDADDFHSESNKEKMASGRPLNDTDRLPWLEMLARELPAWEKAGGAVLACSALKEAYRAQLGSRYDGAIRWVFLHAPEATLAERLSSREGHFIDPGLLNSQLDTLEIPDYGHLIDVEPPVRDIVRSILKRLPAR